MANRKTASRANKQALQTEELRRESGKPASSKQIIERERETPGEGLKIDWANGSAWESL